jgi:hypothetical protein
MRMRQLAQANEPVAAIFLKDSNALTKIRVVRVNAPARPPPSRGCAPSVCFFKMAERKAGMARTAIIGVTIATVLAIAQVRVRRSDYASEASAIGALRAVVTAQLAYAAVNGGYATSLEALAGSCEPGQQGFISPALQADSRVSSAYAIRLQPGTRTPEHVDCLGNPTAAAYYASAVPVQQGAPATRAFAVDQNAVIWFDTGGTAPTVPFRETATAKPLR